jgi:hypothetical protein
MEYKKNRQKVIIETLLKIKNPDWNSLSPPSILSNAQPVTIINKKKNEIKTQQKKLKERIERILARPQYNDGVYKLIQKLMKNKSAYNLQRDNEERLRIRKLAEKRFILGYPPRKNNDISIGDSVHWEWIIDCAIRSDKDIIIVSRDTDFGASYNNVRYLNDWLKQEFNERVSKKKTIILTDKLSEAFKLVDIPVTKNMEDEEIKILANSINNIIEPYKNYTELFGKMIKGRF